MHHHRRAARGKARLPRHPLRPDDIARRNRAIRRPAARRAVGRLRLLLRTARGRGARTQCGRQDTVAERTLIMPHRFPLAIRLLHWTMALLIIAMLFIGRSEERRVGKEWGRTG